MKCTYQYLEIIWPSGESGDIFKACNSKARREGLLKVENLDLNQGLLIPAAPVIHMHKMKISLDLVWINKAGKVVKIKRKASPGFKFYFGAAFTCLELSEGGALFAQIELGSVLDFKEGEKVSTNLAHLLKQR